MAEPERELVYLDILGLVGFFFQAKCCFGVKLYIELHYSAWLYGIGPVKQIFSA